MNPPVLLIAPRLGRWPEAGLGREDMDRLAPSLARLLRQADRIETPVCGLDRLLAEALGREDEGLPWALARSASADARKPPQPWGNATTVCFELLHLRADISNALAHPLSISEDIYSQLIKDLQEEFKADCRFEKTASGGLLRCRRAAPPPGLSHVRDLYGQPLSVGYERLREQPDWYRLHNEMQMFLHLHPLNRERERSGQPLINGLWCWGNAPAPDRPAPITGHADDPEMRQLFAVCAHNGGELEQFRSDGPGHESQLLVWTEWLEGLQGRDIDLAEALRRFDQGIVTRLLESRRPFRLLTGDGVEFVSASGRGWRFWRPSFDWKMLVAGS